MRRHFRVRSRRVRDRGRDAVKRPVRSLHPAAFVALGLACLLASPGPARAQRFVELGGGWNYPGPDSSGDRPGRGYNIRASLGYQLAPRVRVRFDVFAAGFAGRIRIVCPPQQDASPCPSGYSNDYDSVSVAGLSANWLVNVDPRGILYGIGGAGVYDVRGSRKPNDWGIGVSAGLGVSVPIHANLRAFVESRYHLLFGTTAELPWIVPVTAGFRIGKVP